VPFLRPPIVVVGRGQLLATRHLVTRECLAAIPDTSISGRRVARELTALIERRAKPGMIVAASARNADRAP
jgi:hypothetical protein